MAKAMDAIGSVTNAGELGPGDGMAGHSLERAAQAQDIVEELAAALARFSQSANGSRSGSANLPAALPISDFEDDFPDDGPVPIPSSWLEEPESAGSWRWLFDQARAAGVGLGAGLAIVVPVVLILTGHVAGLGNIDLLVRTQPPAPTNRVVVATARSNTTASMLVSEEKPAELIKPRIVVTSPIAIPVAPPQELKVERVEARVVEVKPIEPPVPVVAPRQAPSPEQERAALRTEGQRMVAAGDVSAARDVLARAAAAGDHAAALALGETFDPNMLAAWSVRGVAPDVGAARSLYRRALAAGIGEARVRLDALE